MMRSPLPHRSDASVPTIITTGHSDFAAISGPFPVIRKPFDPDILHAWLVHKLGYG